MQRMIKILMCALLLTFGQGIAAGEWEQENNESVLAVGMLMGASFFGAEYEYLTTEQIGLQLGVGLNPGYTIGLNYHFQPSLDSSALSLAYSHWNFVDESISQKGVVLSYLYRNPKNELTGSLGIGYVFEQGSKLKKVINLLYDDKPPPFLITFTFGKYFDF